MGDASDEADLDRFMRSVAGRAYLDEIVRMLKDRKIIEISFRNQVHAIVTRLHLDDGGAFDLWQPSLSFEAVQEAYEESIEEEYYKDYPDRRPA